MQREQKQQFRALDASGFWTEPLYVQPRSTWLGRPSILSDLSAFFHLRPWFQAPLGLQPELTLWVLCRLDTPVGGRNFPSWPPKKLPSSSSHRSVLDLHACDRSGFSSLTLPPLQFLLPYPPNRIIWQFLTKSALSVYIIMPMQILLTTEHWSIPKLYFFSYLWFS